MLCYSKKSWTSYAKQLSIIYFSKIFDFFIIYCIYLYSKTILSELSFTFSHNIYLFMAHLQAFQLYFGALIDNIS